MMGYQRKFVDLRILFIQPEHEQQNLQQVALDGFQYDRFYHATDLQSALDQLCFNSFDVIILSNDLPTDTTQKLVEYARDHTVPGQLAMTIIVLDQPNAVHIVSDINPQILFCRPQTGVHQMAKDMERAFAQALSMRDAVPVTKSRISDNQTEHAER